MIIPIGIYKPNDNHNYSAKEIIVDTHERSIELTDLDCDITFYLEQETIGQLIKFLQEADQAIKDSYNGDHLP